MYRGIGLVRSVTNPSVEEHTAQLLDVFVFGPALVYAGTQMPAEQMWGRRGVMVLGAALAGWGAWQYWGR